jgi:hypothetical protein
MSNAIKDVVLVHGGFVDGSDWQGVNAIPTKTDVAITRHAMAARDGSTIFVGHPYGGVVITESGNDPKVKGLVYIAAFAPNKEESVSSPLSYPLPGAATPPILPPQDGYLFLDRADIAASFAADTRPAAFWADSQELPLRPPLRRPERTLALI